MAPTSSRSAASTTCSPRPLGTTYQAALTIDTETGTTYYVEVGGYRESGPFGERPPDYGQIRIAVR